MRQGDLAGTRGDHAEALSGRFGAQSGARRHSVEARRHIEGARPLRRSRSGLSPSGGTRAAGSRGASATRRSADPDGPKRGGATAYGAALEIVPLRTDIRVQYGNMLKDSGRLAEAEAVYPHALAEIPGDPDVYLQLG